MTRVRVTWVKTSWVALELPAGEMVRLKAGQDDPVGACDEAASHFGATSAEVEVVC